MQSLMRRKVKRIFIKASVSLILILSLLTVFLYFGIQSFTFQTWLGKKASYYLSKELKADISIQQIQLQFFKKAYLHGVKILDLKQDTLLYGDILVDINNFNFRHQKLSLKTTELKNVTAKLITYKNDSVLNYQFIADYFMSNDKDSSTGKPWQIEYGNLLLNNVSFQYLNQNGQSTLTNHLNYDNLRFNETYGKISNFKLLGDTITATIHQLKTKEHSGFVLNSFDAKVKLNSSRLFCEDLKIVTPNSFIKSQLEFNYQKWEDYIDFITNVQFNTIFEDSTYASFKDIAFFSQSLDGLNETIHLSGMIKGSVADLKLKKFNLAFGKHTRLKGNIELMGLPNIESSFLHLNAKQFSTSYYDITQLPSYPFNAGKKIELPINLKKLGVINYTGKFDGFINDFTTHGELSTDLGKLKNQLSINLGQKNEDAVYDGKLSTQHFNLGTLLGQNDFNGLALDLAVKGKGFTIASLEADVEGNVNAINYNNYTYKNITLDGYFRERIFNGLVNSQDPNANFDFNGSVNFTKKVPELDFISTINALNLSELNFASKVDSGTLSSQILIRINGDNIDNLNGIVNLDNTIYKTKTKTYKLSSLTLQLEQAEKDKRIKLNSAYINGYVKGNYLLSNLKPAFESSLYYYYPNLFNKPEKNKKYTDALSFKLNVKKFNTINELFLPDLMLSPGSSIEGNYSANDNKLNVQFNSEKTKYKSFNFNELVFILNQNDKEILAELSGKRAQATDSLFLDNFNVSLKSIGTNIKYEVDWNNLKQPQNNGELKGEIELTKQITSIKNQIIEITVKDSTWHLEKENLIEIGKNGSVYVTPLSLKNHQQVLEVAGKYCNNPKDSIVVTTKNIFLRQFNPLLQTAAIQLDGLLNGHIALSTLQDNFVFNGNILLSDFKLNDNTIGELSLQAKYNTFEKHIALDGYTSLGLKDDEGNQLKNISFNGFYFLDKKTESIDLNFIAKPANIKLLNPFLTDIITIKNGFVNGEGKIHGSPDNIKIDGKLKLFNSEIKVDYTNVTYNITGEIEIMPDQIRFNDLLMREKGTKTAPQGTVNGNIFHTNFKNIRLDYDIQYKNMLVLNTTEKENPMYYGKIFSSGNVGLYGLLNNLTMEIDNTTTNNSKFYFPLDGPAEIADNDFIKFAKKDTGTVKPDAGLSGFNLDLKLHVTPQLHAQIILDKQNGDALNVQGQGDLSLKINTLGKFEMLGDYLITNGDYLFTLENVINKKFDIEPGSNISWSGDPMNADINITTSYKQRTSIAPLLNDPQYSGRYPVDCKLYINGKLFSPNISFGFDFQSLESTPKARINSVLSDEVELNRQVFSFLLFRSFITPQIFNTGVGGVSVAGGAASTGSEMLSNRVSEFLNTYFGNLTGLKDLQLGVNYRPGNQTNSEAVDLALSKQFFNNRVSVDGNFGVNSKSTQNSNNFIGDVNIEYKLSDDGRYRLKGFNRTNDNTQITTAGGPYTQGVGFFYRVEFERLFNSYKKKIQKNKDTKK